MACYVPGCLGKFRTRIYTVWCADIDTLMMELKQCLGQFGDLHHKFSRNFH